jgi:hypothetical protein
MNIEIQFDLINQVGRRGVILEVDGFWHDGFYCCKVRLAVSA